MALMAMGGTARAESSLPAPSISKPHKPVGPADAARPVFPALSGGIVDDANILKPATRLALARLQAALERRTADRIVVVTTTSLGGMTDENYAIALGYSWGWKWTDAYHVALLVVAPNERKVRIEVAGGVRRRLGDARCQGIIDAEILPRFRAHDYDGGVLAGVGAMADALSAKD